MARGMNEGVVMSCSSGRPRLGDRQAQRTLAASACDTGGGSAALTFCSSPQVQHMGTRGAHP